MENLYSYIKKYKNKTFQEKKFNDIDNMIFSMIAYNGFEKIMDEVDDNTIYSFGKRFMEKYTFKIISLRGLMYEDPYKILKDIYKTKRYKDVLIEDYEYIYNDVTQFCAMTFKIDKNLSYIAFEGTDHSLVGWKEDGEIPQIAFDKCIGCGACQQVCPVKAIKIEPSATQVLLDA